MPEPVRTQGVRLLTPSLSIAGVIVALLALAASLTPGLVPRIWETQAALSGATAALGYGLGVFLAWLWRYLELPARPVGSLRIAVVAALLASAALALSAMFRAQAWQDNLRQLMGMEPLQNAHLLEWALASLILFAVLLLLGRLFLLVLQVVAHRVQRVVPRRIAMVIGVTCATLLFWGVFEGMLLRAGLRLMDSSYKAVDAMIPPDKAAPTGPLLSGSPASLIKWDQLGAQGRRYVTGAPTTGELTQYTPGPVREPLRVYVGMRAAETPKQRAALALAELKRVQAFDRKALIIITPTGTGWVDPGGIESVEFLHNGDIASVAAQYSYLASWLSLLVEPGYAADMSRELFLAVYGHWTTLPKDTRPKLYLHGLSLGAMNSERSSELFEVIGDPYQGAMFAGAPFPSRVWRSITNNRNPGSPEWLPQFRDGAHVRFTAQRNALAEQGKQWGPMRTVYLQYASDAVTFFTPSSFYREPDWMKTPRGPDVSPLLRWTPVVTFFALGLDLAMATTTPMGYGHVYAPEHYLDAWEAIIEPGWDQDRINRLKLHLRQRQAPG